MPDMAAITGKTVLITGANRGIGRALVDEALRRDAARVYMGSRTPSAHPDARVTNLILDVTDAAQTQKAAETITSLDLLVNNAGVAQYDELDDPAVLEHHLAVNLYGTHRMTQAVLPLLARSGGAVANNLSVTAFAPMPITPAYSISKAAALSLTQAQRALLAGRGIRVHAVFIGPTDTDMSRGYDAPKASPQSVARGIFDGILNQEEDIFPDPMSQTMAAGWRTSPAKALEREYAALISQPDPAPVLP